MIKKLFSIVLLIMVCNSCGIYSFTGISTIGKTIYIKNIINRSGGGPPSLAIDFTEDLKEYYQRNSPLSVVDNQANADLIINGEIIQYQVNPVAATSLDQAAQNRFTIAVEINFEDKKEVEKSFENKTFSFYQDFPATQTLTQVENDLIDNIFEQIILDIFDKTVAIW